MARSSRGAVISSPASRALTPISSARRAVPIRIASASSGPGPAGAGRLGSVRLGPDPQPDEVDRRQWILGPEDPAKGTIHRVANLRQARPPDRQLGLRRREIADELGVDARRRLDLGRLDVECGLVEHAEGRVETRPQDVDPGRGGTAGRAGEELARRAVRFDPVAEDHPAAGRVQLERAAPGRLDPEPARHVDAFPGRGGRFLRLARSLEDSRQVGEPADDLPDSTRARADDAGSPAVDSKLARRHELFQPCLDAAAEGEGDAERFVRGPDIHARVDGRRHLEGLLGRLSRIGVAPGRDEGSRSGRQDPCLVRRRLKARRQLGGSIERGERLRRVAELPKVPTEPKQLEAGDQRIATRVQARRDRSLELDGTLRKARQAGRLGSMSNDVEPIRPAVRLVCLDRRGRPIRRQETDPSTATLLAGGRSVAGRRGSIPEPQRDLVRRCRFREGVRILRRVPRTDEGRQHLRRDVGSEPVLCELHLAGKLGTRTDVWIGGHRGGNRQVTSNSLGRQEVVVDSVALQRVAELEALALAYSEGHEHIRPHGLAKARDEAGFIELDHPGEESVIEAAACHRRGPNHFLRLRRQWVHAREHRLAQRVRKRRRRCRPSGEKLLREEGVAVASVDDLIEQPGLRARFRESPLLWIGPLGRLHGCSSTAWTE
jgi:hypothetical protein